MDKITIVKGNDWEGLYFNDVLMYEAHHIEIKDIVKYCRLNFEIKNLNDKGIEWLENEGNLPSFLNDIWRELIEDSCI